MHIKFKSKFESKCGNLSGADLQARAGGVGDQQRVAQQGDALQPGGRDVKAALQAEESIE